MGLIWLLVSLGSHVQLIFFIIQLRNLALFLDGLLRILGIIPPFMDLDVNVIDDIIEKTTKIVESDMIKSGLNKLPRTW